MCLIEENINREDMRKELLFTRSFFLFFCLCFVASAYGIDIFSLAGKSTSSSTLSVGQSYAGSHAMALPTEPINGLSINGRITIQDDDYFVRFLLKDKKGNEYVVMESYKELNDDSSIDLKGYCEETALLSDVVPDSLKLIIHHATFQCDNIVLLYSDRSPSKDKDLLLAQAKEIRIRQTEDKAERINRYNKSHKKLWFAGVTDLSTKDFATRMRQLGFRENQNTGGLEYYIGGIFEMGETLHRDTTSSPYVNSFDWRDRHGKNWMTSVKNQGGSNYCAAFATTATLEALTNLYYNRKLDLDLSEQEAARCTGYGGPSIYFFGMPLQNSIDYVAENGLCDEISYPFLDANTPDCIRGQITPNYIAQPEGLRNYHNDWYSIKHELINHGPLISGYYSDTNHDSIDDYGHAMALVGYGKIQANEVYSVVNNGIFYNSVGIDVHDERIGQTYWIFKNSYYGEHEWEHDGYVYIIFNNPSSMISPVTFELPISTWGVENSEIICEDSDGDGYYFWGLGNKPSSCPYWVPGIPDGDDSNSFKGAMDQYGNLSAIGLHYPWDRIYGTETYDDNRGLIHNIYIENGGVLSITGETVMANCKIIVKNGGTLIIDGGRLLHSDIEMEPSSTLRVINGGLIHMKPGLYFSAPAGANVLIEEGEIS